MIVTLGERIRELRLRLGRTQEELADNLATLSMIAQVEENKALPSYPLLSLIADKLETTVGNLIGDSAPTIESSLLYRIAKASALTHDYEVAVNLYRELMKQEFGISKLQLMHEYAECLIAVSDPQQAVEGLSESLESASEKDRLNHALMSHMYYTLGTAYSMMDNHVLAYHTLHKALMEYALDDEQDPAFVANVYKSLADMVQHVNVGAYPIYLKRASEQFDALTSEEVAGLQLEQAYCKRPLSELYKSVEPLIDLLAEQEKYKEALVLSLSFNVFLMECLDSVR